MPVLQHGLRRSGHAAQRRFPFGLFLLPALLLYPPTDARPETVDPHTLFEKRCSRCHGHAGNFAREALTIEDGELVGRRSGMHVLRKLGRHFGRLSDAESDLIVDMFRRQIEAGGLYESKCRICHDPAKDFARQTLILRDGQLFGRYSGRPVADLLNDHGRLQDDERKGLLDMLIWQLATAPGKTDAD